MYCYVMLQEDLILSNMHRYKGANQHQPSANLTEENGDSAGEESQNEMLRQLEKNIQKISDRQKKEISGETGHATLTQGKNIFDNKTPWIVLLIAFCFLVSAILLGFAIYNYTDYTTKVELAEQETKRLEINTKMEEHIAVESTRQTEIKGNKL